MNLLKEYLQLEEYIFKHPDPYLHAYTSKVTKGSDREKLLEAIHRLNEIKKLANQEVL